MERFYEKASPSFNSNMRFLHFPASLRSIGLTGSLMLAFSFCFGQKAQLTGTITDASTLKPVSGATISVESQSAGTFSKEDGSYTLSLSTGQDHEVKVSFIGYNTQVFTINLTSAGAMQGIQLQPEDLQSEDVVITAARSFEQKQSDVTVSVEVVKQEAIDLQAQANVEQVITQIPGVDNLDGQINIRGSSGYAYGIGSRVMVMMDGLPLLSGDASFPELSLIPVDNISQIEVVKGASSVLYGSGALGGVINVIMSQPGDKPRTSVRLRGALFDNPSNPHLRWRENGNGYQGSAHIFHSRRVGDLDLTGQADLIRNDNYEFGRTKREFRGILLTRFRPKAIQGLNVGVNLSARVDSSGDALFWAGYNPDTLQNIEGADSTIVGGAWRPNPGDGVFRRQLNSRLAVDPYIKYLTPKGNLFWYRGRYLRNVNQNNSGQSSQNYILYNDFLFQTTLAKKINWVSGITYNFAQARADSLYTGVKRGNSTGIYTQFDGKFGRLNTSLGLRLETVEIDTLERETQPVFRAGANYEVWPGGNVRASFGQAFRVPSVAERFANTQAGGLFVVPNPTIQSELGYGAEIAFRQGFKFENPKNKTRGYIDIAAFTQRYENMVEFGVVDLDLTPIFNGTSTLPRPVFTSKNVSEARVNGIEVTLNAESNWEKWFVSFNGGITLLDPLNLTPASPDQQTDLISFDKRIDTINSLEGLAQLAYISRFLEFLTNEVEEKQDNPETLKYRSRTTIRGSATVGYDRLSLTGNFRYRSFIESIDQYLYAVVPELATYRTEINSTGDPILDLILNYHFGKSLSISLNVGNVFNHEYMLIPGNMAEPRKYTLQWVWRF
jgi:iron complex outermembrane receptor protein